ALIQCYGFTATKKLDSGEVVFEKFMHKGLIKTSESVDIWDLDRKIYPRFYDGPEVAKYCVPIRGEYHKKAIPRDQLPKTTPTVRTAGFCTRIGSQPDTRAYARKYDSQSVPMSSPG